MDFSQEHAPIGQFLDLPGNSQDWQKYRLTEKQLAAFQENGFVAGVQVLNDGQVEQLRSELAALMKKSHPANHLFQRVSLQRVE